MIGQLGALKTHGVLGINRRNGDYIMRYNPRRCYPLVDNKLNTKKLAQAHDIPVPELYHHLSTEHEIKELESILSAHQQFVVKPANGSGGDGILVIVDNLAGEYRLASGELISHKQLCHHVSNTLSGRFSLGGIQDSVIFEYKVTFDEQFTPITHHAVPDIRVLVFLGVPVMAMMRLPTQASQGKANLHQGAIGVGVSMAQGVTRSGVCHNTYVTAHPDTKATFSDLQLPGWEHLLTLAAGCFELTDMGYIGVDIVLDKDKGPLMLELNARPGLSIQIANRAGLLPRLTTVESLPVTTMSIGSRVAFAREHFN